MCTFSAFVLCLLMIASRLNPSSPIPLYMQLAGILREQIQAGQWAAGALLPSEADLGRDYDVSRTVVRQALDQLAGNGMIQRRKGKGSFVAERKLTAYLLQDAAGFAANMAAQGYAVRSVVLKRGLVTASPMIAAALGVPEDAPVYRLERLRFVADEPIYVGATHVPEHLAELIAACDFQVSSLNLALAEHANITPAGGDRLIEAIAAGPIEAELLRVRIGAPLFHLFAVTRDPKGAAIECSEVWLRGDRIAFRVALGAIPLPDATQGKDL